MHQIYSHIAELSNTIRDLERIKESKFKKKEKEELLYNDLNNILLDLYTAWSDNFIVSLNQKYPNLTILKDRRKYPDKRIFFTFPLNKIKGKAKKKDIPAVCVGLNAKDIVEGKADILVIIENDKETYTLPIERVGEVQIKAIVESLAKFFSNPHNHTYSKLPRIIHSLLSSFISIKYNFEMTKLPNYCPYSSSARVAKNNLKTLAWLKHKIGSIQNIPVNRKKEELLNMPLGGEIVEFLKSGDMYFIMNNVPTIKIMDLAIKEGIMTEKNKKNYISLEQEIDSIQQTKQKYKKTGSINGRQKDYRKNNFWRDAKANFEYDPERGMYYLEIGNEPVMDEFEREFISLLGQNSARYGGVVLEVGFGMGISAKAIQKELLKHMEQGSFCTHIILELNRNIVKVVKRWAVRQKVPVIILQGDWKDTIKEIPDNILTGALADPYPLDVSEKHEDAARTLKEIYRCLRPGGIVTYYSDSQYALSKRHMELARLAGFKYIGNVTSSFGKHLNTGEYYLKGLRMAIPSLYKDDPNTKRKPKFLNIGNKEKKEIIQRLFIENPARFMDFYDISM